MMRFRTLVSVVGLLLLAGAQPLLAQPGYQTDFPIEEFAARRHSIMDSIGTGALALLQGQAAVEGFYVFRQTNDFYYLTGLEVPHAYLLIDGTSRQSTLYLAHRNAGRERNEGKVYSAEDADEVKRLTGVDRVEPIEALMRDFIWSYLVRLPNPILFTPFSPAEGQYESRDEILGGVAAHLADPWDGASNRTTRFVQLLRDRYPQLALHDLSPALDAMRLVKSNREIDLIRTASELAGLGIMEAIRSTAPGVMEYQIDAAANVVFSMNGARSEGYRSITAGGKNAWMGHYFHNSAPLVAGDLVLMDVAPDYRYYTSDVARMWPVNGTYSKDQRDMYGFIIAYRNALLKHIRPGVTPAQVMDEAAADMRPVLDRIAFSKPIYRTACEKALAFRGHLSHPVGMAVHDVGVYRNQTLKPGMVFSIDPMIWVDEETLYIRMEDVVVVTETGVENLSDNIPAEMDELEALIREEGIVQLRPAVFR
ncbi:MAG: aminopeptidase P N-terminal domain-containing protein [Rhodothermales bacterium]|nr:aminopeptidase P N-terminal domain-containing protein [Rhodothermales bacterium]